MEDVPPSHPVAPPPPPPPLPASAAPPPPPKVPSAPPYVGDCEADEEVVTSVRPHALAEQREREQREASARTEAAALPAPAPPPARQQSRPNLPTPPPPPKAKPPPLPPRARPALPKPSAPEIPVPVTPAPLAVALEADVPEALAPPPPPPPPPVPEAPAALSLENIEAFADLPDDARTAFAAAAMLHSLAEGEEIGTFALAYVVSGICDVSATMVDAPAVRLTTGAVLRARGTTTEGVPMRLICAQPADKGSAAVATWSDAAVEEAFRSIPWVEQDLRVAADRVQTLVGITIGPLGERLDVSIREVILARLTMRPLYPSEIVVRAGEPVPGLLLVGIGELELVNKDDKVSGVVGSGEFLFPTEVLGAGSAPTTARAGAGGALVMFGDRAIAQELLVTCPPLLEVFAGM